MEAEAQLARALMALTEREFPLSRGKETRLDAYLQLEELMRLEDSEASVLELQHHVPSLLSEIRFDLQHNALSDVLHAALRCLSYLMHHCSLAAAFSDEHMGFFLGELVRLLFSTQDQSTYKLCLWGLTMQNFPAERQKLLPRTVEGLVQAVVNPFKSRAIEVQALKGLHLLLVKYPEQLGIDGAVLSIYVRPIASRLASSEAATRTQARLVLEEASKHLTKWSQETMTMVQHCAENYVLPVMKMHMENDRHKDAVYLWKLTLVLLKSKFSSDLGKLNQVLFVPEKCMEDEDAAVRLMAMQAWGEVVEIFHECQNWFFNKAVVSLLVWPIKLCLEQELLLNVVDAAFESWRKIVRVAVNDFNTHCKAQQQAVEAGEQQNVPEWKFWYGELVMSHLLILMKKRMKAKDTASTVELDQFINFTKKLWEHEERGADKSKNSPSRSENSSSTTMGGSSVDVSVGKQSRMEYLKDMYIQCATVVEKWKTGELQIEFTAKENALPYLVINLLFEYAVFVDDTNNDCGDAKQFTLTSLEVVVNKLLESVKAGDQQQTQGLDSVIRFVEESIRAAHDLTAYDYASEERSMLDELVSISQGLTGHTYASQQNASLLLDLHQSRGRAGVVVSATTASSADTSDAEEKSASVVMQVSASLDASTSSPCLLSGEISTIPSATASSADEEQNNNDKQSPDRSTATIEEKIKAKAATAEDSEKKETKTSDAKVPVLPAEAAHFPLEFRPFFSFYKVKTIGDLSALPVEKVRTFGLKEPVSTVRRALEEFNGRKDRMKTLTGSPFRRRGGSAFSSPAIPTPSPHKPSKRPFHLESGSIAPLSLEKREHKRTKRSLVLDAEDGEEEESEGTRRKPKLADRVTFCLQTGETGETRITRPGEDSQDQLKPSEKVEEKESMQEKMDTYTLKLLQHLRRSAYYMDKLVTEEESIQSEEASLGTTIANVGGVITNYQEAHELVARLASQLQIAVETSSERCRKLLDKRG
ncbi:hypothetical protein PI126_g8612 [Phytophthora idaei]|nr:hypothetical protein PI126_g8612 [Phytophthora idaei]